MSRTPTDRKPGSTLLGISGLLFFITALLIIVSFASGGGIGIGQIVLFLAAAGCLALGFAMRSNSA